MKNSERNLLVLFKNREQEADCLHEILLDTISPENFCVAHELVDRNRITSKKSKLLKEASYFHLRAFRFFINKN